MIAAVSSGNPDVVKELLRYHPNMDAKGREGRTALFAAGEHRNTDQDNERAEIVRLLTAAGANVNARDKGGNTPLHSAFSPEVAAELLKLGANVNAQNHKGETPVFTTQNDQNIPLFVQHGADLSIRNLAGDTPMEAAKKRSSSREAALAKAAAEYGRK